MRDIFICPHGNMLENWSEACPKAMVSTSVVTVPVNEPVVFWLHANANSLPWIEKNMAEITRKFQASRIVVLANSPNQMEALAVISKGAAGYCHAYSSAQVLSELKTVVVHGGVWLGRDLLQTLIGASRELVHNPSEQVNQTLSLLTSREQEVALEACIGLSNKEIARALNITERTVKAHISKTLEKLGLKDRLQLALILNQRSGESALATKPAKFVNAPEKKHAVKKPQPVGHALKKKLELAA